MSANEATRLSTPAKSSVLACLPCPREICLYCLYCAVSNGPVNRTGRDGVLVCLWQQDASDGRSGFAGQDQLRAACVPAIGCAQLFVVLCLVMRLSNADCKHAEAAASHGCLCCGPHLMRNVLYSGAGVEFKCQVRLHKRCKIRTAWSEARLHTRSQALAA